MKKHLNKKLLISLSIVALIAGCGGGGGGTDSAAATTDTLANSTVTDPLTGTLVPGSPTKKISGSTYVNATVTAYSVQPDGTNGPALGPSNTTDSAGGFALVLSEAPTGMVRLVAVGGSYMASDGTIQQNTAMELVTPYLATGLNHFKISPLTHIASHVLSFKAKNGATLVDAFKAGMRSVLELDWANIFFLDDTTVYINLLKGSITSDKMTYNYASLTAYELLSAIEWFGAQYDLPSSVVVRVLSAAAENEYPSGTVDGAGKAINVGKWVNGTFDETVPLSLDTMMALNTPDGQTAVDPKTGKSVHPRVPDFITRNLIIDFVVHADCGMGTTQIMVRYPFYHLEDSGGRFMRIPAAECLAVAQRIANLKGRVTTNNRSISRPAT